MSSPPPFSSVRSHPPGTGVPPRSSPRSAAAGAPSAGNNNTKPSLRSRAARFFARDGPGGLTLGAWATIAAATVFMAVVSWKNDHELQERKREAEREVFTSSSEDWRHAKREAREAAKDARSAASKWSKGQ